MKTILFILSLAVSICTATSCKTKKAATTSSSSASSSTTVSTTTSTETNTTASGENQGANVGKVSHKYRTSGCETVIVFTSAEGTEMTLIPKDKLNKDIDVDGQTIKFDYHPLRMPQPAGCTVGIPAEITNITKLK